MQVPANILIQRGTGIYHFFYYSLLLITFAKSRIAMKKEINARSSAPFKLRARLIPIKKKNRYLSKIFISESNYFSFILKSVSAAFTAIENIFPIVPPFFSPLKWEFTGFTNLFR